jgi:hypothetical protein
VAGSPGKKNGSRLMKIVLISPAVSLLFINIIDFVRKFVMKRNHPASDKQIHF